MTPKRIKIHPIGYVPIQAKGRNTDHRGETKKHVQTIRMKNGQIRTIQHYTSLSMFGGFR